MILPAYRILNQDRNGMGWDTMESLNMGYSIISEPMTFIFIFPSFSTEMSFDICPFSTDVKSLPAGILSIPNPNEINPNHAKIGIQSKFKRVPSWVPIYTFGSSPILALPQGLHTTRRSHSKWPNRFPHAGLRSGGIGDESFSQYPSWPNPFYFFVSGMAD